jgi:hypothetical protein
MTTTNMFSGLEWTVLRMAQEEACRGVTPCASSRLGATLDRLWAVVSGRRGALPLANPRLEALRRFACAAVIGGASLQSATAGLLQAGYTPAHVELAQAAVTSR